MLKRESRIEMRVLIKQYFRPDGIEKIFDNGWRDKREINKKKRWKNLKGISNSYMNKKIFWYPIDTYEN